MKIRFEIFLIICIVTIFGGIAIGISTQIPINRIITNQIPRNNLSNYCYDEDIINNNDQYYNSDCCYEENNTNYECQNQNYTSCCNNYQTEKYTDNYRYGCH